MFVRTLTILKVDGELAGYYYPLIVGLMSIVGAIVYFLSVESTAFAFTIKDYLFMIFGGLCESVGMVL